MSKPEACDAALLKAMAEDPRAEAAVEGMMQAQEKFNSKLTEEMDWIAMESEIPAPGNADWDALNPAPAVKPAKGKLGKAADLADAALQEGKQMRVALMLSNPLTHVKNVTANTGQAVIVRPLEEAMGFVISKARGNEVRHRSELYHYAGGMLRGGQDAVSVLATLGKTMLKKGAFDAEDVKVALKDAGYSEELAMGKPDLIHTVAPTASADAENIAVAGVKYLSNGAYGSQFSALQGADTMFKMISHRAKVQQILSRKGFQEGIVPAEGLDEYVSKNWKEMSERVKNGEVVDDDLSGIQKRGEGQAAEDTFTETPQTALGKLMSGKYDTSVGWKKVMSESMQIIAPFRSIYVNLMRQSISRRLVPFFDGKTRGEIMGKMGPEAQNLAMARTAGAWTLFGGTAALITTTGIKLHGPDEMDPAVRDMQFQLHGKVGNTIQIGDQYFPVDMLPPSLAFPLIYASFTMDGIEEHNYRYSEDGDVEGTFMAGFGPFMQAVTDGPWVKEYTDFLHKMNGYTQSGNVEGMGTYLAQLTAGPMKPPKWIQKVRGYDPHVKTSDGFMDKVRTDWNDDFESYGHRRNMFGEKIMPLQRMGDQSQYPWYGADTDVNNLLRDIEYDKVMATNISRKVRGEGNGNNGVAAGEDSVQMSAKARDRFEYYVGKSDAGGATFQDQVRELMNVPGVWDFENNKLNPQMDKLNVQTQLAKLHSKRRQDARMLVKFHPAFGIREQQINKFYGAAVKRGMDPQDAQAIMRQQTEEMNQIRLQYRAYF